MLIAIDVDEVLADFSSALVEYHNNKYHRGLLGYRPEMKHWWQAWGKTKEGAIGRVYEFINSREVLKIDPIPGAVEGVRALKESGHDLVVITGRPIEAMDETWTWLNVHFPDMFGRAYSTDFHLVNRGKENKGDICARRGVKLLIDDFFEYCLEAREKGVPSLLFTTPWNRDLELPAGISRANNWAEIVNYVKSNGQAA
ncbi:MAG: hypothetical protein V1867_04815 [Candidatus Falkowbacteria bacterium]